MKKDGSRGSRIARLALALPFLAVALGALAVGGGAALAADSYKTKFPAELQPLLDGVPEPIIQSIWEVRQTPPDTIVWKDGGGGFADGERKAYFSKWEKLTGWTVKADAPSAKPGDVQAQVQSGSPQFDIFENSSDGNAILEQEQGLLEPLDPKLFDAVWAYYPKGYQHTTHWIDYGMVGAIVIYNSERWPETGKHPTSALDLFNTAEFPGKRCIYKFINGSGTIEYPLMADGVAPDKLFPLDVPRALKKLDTIRNDIVWWSGGAQSVQFILDGECDIGITWHGRPAALHRDNPKTPIGAVWKDSMILNTPFSIIKGTKHLKAAQSALAYAFTPKQMCDLLNTVGYGVPIDESCLSDFARKWSVTKDHQAMMVPADNAWYAKNVGNVTDQLNAWLTK